MTTYGNFHLNKVSFLSYEVYSKWVIIAIAMLILNGLNYYATSQIIDFVPVSKLVVLETNNLMRTENNLI